MQALKIVFLVVSLSSSLLLNGQTTASTEAFPSLAEDVQPLQVFTNPRILNDFWLDEPVPLSSYSEKELAIQRQINEKVADAVITYAPLDWEKEYISIDFEEITPYTWKWIELELIKSNGTLSKIHLRRPHWWLRESGATKVGNQVYLDMPEMGIQGWATLKDIYPNQLDTRLWDEERDGDYIKRPITGKFEHESGEVFHLYFGEDQEPLGVTGKHRIWSKDRAGWIGAGELIIGEKVKTRRGIVELRKKEKVNSRCTVFNIEVFREHNYWASLHNILVHNSCWDDFKKRMGDVVEVLDGNINMGGYDGETLIISIGEIYKREGAPKGAAFKRLTKVAEEMAEERGFSSIEIKFEFVLNDRLRDDSTWAREFGYHYTPEKFLGNESQPTHITWSKYIE